MHPKLSDGDIAGPDTHFASAEHLGAMLRASGQGCAINDPSMLALLSEAVTRLTGIVRATGGDVAIVSTGAGWNAVSAGQYRYDSTGGVWSFPRPGDADYLWGERARVVLEKLAEHGWQSLAPHGGETGLLVRSNGAWLMTCAGNGDPALFHAVRGEGLELVGLQGNGQVESPGNLVRSNRQITFVSLEDHARAEADPAPTIAAPLADWGDDAPDISADAAGSASESAEIRPKIVLSDERDWKEDLRDRVKDRLGSLIARGLSRRR